MTKQQYWAGAWWHCSRYEIQDGYIRPAANASIVSFDPWEIYEISKKDSATSPPYQSLLELLSLLGAFFDEARLEWRLDDTLEHKVESFAVGDYLTPHQKNAILEWCCRFGLLGILPHTALAIELPRRYGPHGNKLVVFERAHHRINGLWTSELSANYSLEDQPYPDVQHELHVLEQDDPILGPLVSMGEAYFHVPTVLFSKTTRIDGEDSSMEHILRRFFPDFITRDREFECPLPLSREFWRIYSERVDEFLLNGLMFLNTAEPLASRRTSADLSAWAPLLEPIGIALSFDADRNVRQQWVCPSLLSSFARMALQDISAGMRILLCDCCGGPFVTSSYRSRYCKQTCAWRHRKRRIRSKDHGVLRRDEIAKKHRDQS